MNKLTKSSRSFVLNKTAILIAGRPDADEYYDAAVPTNSNNHWFPWLTKQLMINDILTVSVEVPKPWQPRYDVWKKEFERFDITPDTMLVGHSCGGGFLVRYLSENKAVHVGKVILVAPWINPENNPVSDTADFFDFEIDVDFPARTAGVTIFNSDDDQATIHTSVELIRAAAPNVKYREFHGYGHFCLENLKTEAFPELAEALLNGV